MRAGGAVLWRRSDGGDPAVAVVHRPRHRDWTLPKGKPRTGESLPATARREVREETGCDAALGRWLGASRYRVESGGTEKRVDYWVARAGDGPRPVDAPEVDEVAWLPVDAARERLTWESEREVLSRFEPVTTTTVLLVRHARAGSRDAWAGLDDERPLDPLGLVQRAVLASMLPAYWLDAERPFVASAPVTRCTDTVGWAGEVTPDERLGERTFRDYPEAAVAAVRDAAERAVSVLCTQGSVVPYVVESLRRSDGLAPAGVRASKGSTWVLSFASGRLVAADYLDAI